METGHILPTKVSVFVSMLQGLCTIVNSTYVSQILGHCIGRCMQFKLLFKLKICQLFSDIFIFCEFSNFITK
jgi:hypothetical protein